MALVDAAANHAYGLRSIDSSFVSDSYIQCWTPISVDAPKLGQSAFQQSLFIGDASLNTAQFTYPHCIVLSDYIRLILPSSIYYHLNDITPAATVT